MLNSPNPSGPHQKQYPISYMAQDRSSPDEMVHLDLQDQMVTQHMGGVLPEQPDPTSFRQVLDVGCGTGRWIIEVAKTYPTIPALIGVDISDHMIAHAQAETQVQQMQNRVSFRTMDALRRLEFPDGSFDLVNQRLGLSFLRKWDWSKILREYQRITMAGGTIRITESSLGISNSPALTLLNELLLQAYSQSGNLFTPEEDGLIKHLAETMTKYGIDEVQTQFYHIEYHQDPQTLHYFAQDMQRLFRNLAPFLRKWTRVPDNYEDIYQQMLEETQQSGFEARATILTAWGKKVFR